MLWQPRSIYLILQGHRGINLKSQANRDLASAQRYRIMIFFGQNLSNNWVYLAEGQ
jgi:hypothetical protein